MGSLGSEREYRASLGHLYRAGQSWDYAPMRPTRLWILSCCNPHEHTNKALPARSHLRPHRKSKLPPPLFFFPFILINLILSGTISVYRHYYLYGSKSNSNPQIGHYVVCFMQKVVRHPGREIMSVSERTEVSQRAIKEEGWSSQS